MYLAKNKVYSKLQAIGIAAAGSVLLPALFMVVGMNSKALAQEEEQEMNSIDEEKTIGKILNLYGKEMGSVDSKGNIANAFGSPLGSVDSNGTIYNVSKIEIGKVAADGTVFNQSGTVMGSVNNKGEVFNVSGTKMGEIKGESDKNKTGGAARLVLLKNK
jgi:hypothetical protein